MNEQKFQRFQLALTVLRVLIGIIFIAHGYQKFFEYTIPGTTGAFGQMGVPLAGVAAPVVATLELVGGLALVAGFLTRITAGLLTLNMLGAIVLVHLKGGFFAPNGIELPLSLMASTVALALGGAGAFALDGLRKREQQVIRA